MWLPVICVLLIPFKSSIGANLIPEKNISDIIIPTNQISQPGEIPAQMLEDLDKV